MCAALRTGSPEFRTRFHRKPKRSVGAWPRRSSLLADRRIKTPLRTDQRKTGIYSTLQKKGQ